MTDDTFVTHRSLLFTDDLCSQYGTYAKDLGEGGAASFYLSFDPLV